jgi:hypothetical protein
MERHHLRDLVNDIRQRGQKTDPCNCPVERRSAPPEPEDDQRKDGEAGDGVAVKILRERFVVGQEVELEE